MGGADILGGETAGPVMIDRPSRNGQHRDDGQRRENRQDIERRRFGEDRPQYAGDHGHEDIA